MNSTEKQLLESVIGDTEPLLCIPTLTRVDVGLWWRRQPLWLCLTDKELVTLAASKRSHVEKVNISNYPDIHYNPTGGELIIDPMEDIQFPRVKMRASDALKVMKILKSNKPVLTPHT